MKLLRKRLHRKGFIMETEELVLRFEGENDIELETLSKSLNATTIITRELASELIQDNEFCKIIVKNIEPGSFRMIIQTVMEYAPSLLPHVPTIINGFKSILELKKALNGEDPKEITTNGNNVSIKNNKGNIYIIDKVVFDTYTGSEKIEKSISELANTVFNDKSRQGLEISFNEKNGDSNKVKMNKNELQEMSKELDVTSFAQNIEENISTTMVKVIKPDLVGNTKWSIYRDSQKINCSVVDESFLSKVREGKILFKGKMLMKVQLMSRYKVNDDSLPTNDCKTTYKIVKVLEVEINNEMIKLEDI